MSIVAGAASVSASTRPSVSIDGQPAIQRMPQLRHILFQRRGVIRHQQRAETIGDQLAFVGKGFSPRLQRETRSCQLPGAPPPRSQSRSAAGRAGTVGEKMDW